MKDFYALIKYLDQNCITTLSLTFGEIYAISGVQVDSSFIDNKKFLAKYGISVMKINVGSKTVLFSRKA